uniref:Uncharacterized protein n=1 Tax=Anopheles atroparvus TaxID=41427 RepID=A0A182IWB0_ANOAO
MHTGAGRDRTTSELSEPPMPLGRELLRGRDERAPGGIGLGRLKEGPDLADLSVGLHVALVDAAHLVHVQERQQLVDLSAQVLPEGSTEQGQQDDELHGQASLRKHSGVN